MAVAPNITIPLSIPHKQQKNFSDNYQALTKGTNRLFLFAADHKIEHLNTDFYYQHAPSSPDYLFKLAGSPGIGAFATHLGLINRYAEQYPTINYIAKLNGKTPLISAEQNDPISSQLWTIEDVMQSKQNGVSIRGVGYTIYIGSIYEHIMLQEAAQIVAQAHGAGLVAILWIYARGEGVQHADDGMLAAGAAGLAASLGADFVKIKPPACNALQTSSGWIRIAQEAAGTTNVICSGEEYVDAHILVKRLYEQLHEGNASGAALGRNIFQRSGQEAKKLINAIAALIYKNADLTTAMEYLK